MRTEINDIVLVGQPLRAVPAAVQVNVEGGGLATVYTAGTGSITKANPFATDAYGRIEGFLDPGSYELVVSAIGYDDYTQPLQVPLDSSTVVRNSTAVNPVNAEKLRISLTGTDPEADLDVNLTTPQSSQVIASRYDDLDRLTSPNPGVYNWGVFAYEVNEGTAPVTPIAARARGNSVYTLSSSGRAYGKDPQIHGLEITVGVFASVATATVANGSSVLTAVSVTQDGRGSRFETGMSIAGAGIPTGVTITGVTGRPGSPSSITISAPATADGTAVTITAQAAGTLESIGALITGNGGTADGEGNPTGIGILLQAQNDQSRWFRGLAMGASALRPDATAIRLYSHTAQRGVSFESSTYENAIYLSGVTTSGGAISLSGVTAPIGINFAASNVFATSAIHLAGQNISTDTTTGMKVATNSTQKLGFYGRTPITRPSLPAAGVVTADDLRAALVALGLAA